MVHVKLKYDGETKKIPGTTAQEQDGYVVVLDANGNVIGRFAQSRVENWWIEVD